MSKFKGKKVLVVGLGKSGVAAARYLTKAGAKVTITDAKPKHELQEYVDQCNDLKVEWELGRHNPVSFISNDLIVLSPGIPLNSKFLEEALQKKIPITSEFEMAVQGLKEPLITVTGTNGKTTVTALIGEMIAADQRPVFVGGNIGTPLLDYLTDGKKADYVVGEISSFQIELIQKITPAVAVFTNLEADHLDRYGDAEAYFQAKMRLLRQCDRNTFVVMNYDSTNLARFVPECQGKIFWCTKKNPLQLGGDFAEHFTGAYLNMPAKQMILKINGKEEVYDISQYRLFGEHNRENLMAAACAARALNISPVAIQKVIKEFKGVAHRLEFVRKKDGVYFINDSKGTNVMSVQKSLESFNNPIILIAGGKDKNQEFSPLAELVRKKVKILILLGEGKEKLNRAIGDFSETYLVGTFEEAVLLAFQKSRNGDIVLLSPGCASYDMFKNFEERGDYFKKLVHQL